MGRSNEVNPIIAYVKRQYEADVAEANRLSRTEPGSHQHVFVLGQAMAYQRILEEYRSLHPDPSREPVTT